MLSLISTHLRKEYDYSPPDTRIETLTAAAISKASPSHSKSFLNQPIQNSSSILLNPRFRMIGFRNGKLLHGSILPFLSNYQLRHYIASPITLLQSPKRSHNSSTHKNSFHLDYLPTLLSKLLPLPRPSPSPPNSTRIMNKAKQIQMQKQK